MWPSPGCGCKTPHPKSDPRFATSCVVCGRHIHQEWSSEHIAPMIDRLTDIPEVQLSQDFRGFRELCVGREQDGREHFGFRYLGRNNEADAAEEVADLVNYAAFGVLKRLREERDPLDDMALMAAFHAFRCYAIIRDIERKDGGAP